MPDREIPDPGWPDKRLVEACLEGCELAWKAFVDKYQNLVYSIIHKYGAAPEEAADVFQSVWLDAYNDLPKLRKKSAVRSWLISLTNHRCYHWKQKRRRQDFREVGDLDPEMLEDQTVIKPDFAEGLERDQLVREAVFKLSPRCREMIRLLFFVIPPKPYQEVAERLGLATGSIGFIRGRCLQQLRKVLEKQGL
ncbi:MAG: sigma-70 family RNA polymerase sigma factor [bacterium]|nr:sigma-70 family RNA polymerase sigma factor [bacterium]